MSYQTVSTPSYLSDKELSQRYGCSRATIWRWTKNNPDFPKPIKLGGCTRWRISELIAWEGQF